MSPAGTKMPEKPPPEYYCGTNSPGWLQGSHPTQRGQSVSRKACHNWRGRTCYSHRIVTVTNCGGYFVYKLPLYPGIHRYCATFDIHFAQVDQIETRKASDEGVPDMNNFDNIAKNELETEEIPTSPSEPGTYKK